MKTVRKKTTNPQYYEGILQLRNINDEEVFNLFRNQLKKHPDVFVSKEVKQKTGMDYYLSSNKFVLMLGRKLNKTFKGELKISRKIHTRDRQTSKNLYRVTVLFRLS